MLMNGTIYALKVGGVEQEVFRSIQQGEGRFGWSYIENADLHYLSDKWQKGGWSSLSADEQACYQGFLLDIKPNDYVVVRQCTESAAEAIMARISS